MSYDPISQQVTSSTLPAARGWEQFNSESLKNVVIEHGTFQKKMEMSRITITMQHPQYNPWKTGNPDGNFKSSLHPKEPTIRPV